MQNWTTCLAYQKTLLCLSVVTDEDGNPLENEDESGRRLCEYWGNIFQARVEGTIDRTEFDELIAMKKDSAPGPDGIPYGAKRCAG